MVTREELNPHGFPLNEIQDANLTKLAAVLSELEALYGKPFIVTSGFRTAELQEKVNPYIKQSAHMSGEAADIADADNQIWGWLMDHLEDRKRLGVYLESHPYTPRWVHIQLRVPKSGSYVFIPR